MHTAFEVIMCSFEKSLQAVRVTRANDLPGRTLDLKDPTEWTLLQATASRYHGIGGNRATIHYDNFVTAFSYPDIDVFASGEGQPRLSGISGQQSSQILSDIDSMARDTSHIASSTDWQAVVDIIIARFGPRLRYLKEGNFSHADALHNQTILVIQPYVDWDHRNLTLETERCATQYIPRTSNGLPLAGQVVLQVTRTICNTLLAASEDGVEYATAMKIIDELMEYLSWTTWKECTPGCQADEICFAPVWPWGKPGDIENPPCVTADGFVERWGYWVPRPDAKAPVDAMLSCG
jgi:hypothetical protein